MRKKIYSVFICLMLVSITFSIASAIAQPNNLINQITKQSAVDGDIFIDGEIKCPTKPFLYGCEEKFYVTINNTGDNDVVVMVEFRLWSNLEREWEFFGESRGIIPPGGIKDTNPVSLSWSFKIWEIEWIRAELYVDDVLVDTHENRFFMGFFIF